MIVIERREAGALAKSLRARLAALGVHIAHQASTVAVSAALGFADPNAMSAALRHGPLVLLLGDEETARDGNPPEPLPGGRSWVDRAQAVAQFLKLVMLHLGRSRRFMELGENGMPGTRSVPPPQRAAMGAAIFGAATDVCRLVASSGAGRRARRVVVPDDVQFSEQGILCELRAEGEDGSWARTRPHHPVAAGARLAAYLSAKRGAAVTPEAAAEAWLNALAEATFLVRGAMDAREPLGHLLRACGLDAWLTEVEPERAWPGTDRLRPDVALAEAIIQGFSHLLLLRHGNGAVGRFSGTYFSSDLTLQLMVPGGHIVVERLAGPVAGVPVDFVTANDTEHTDADIAQALRAAAAADGHFPFATDGSQGVNGLRHRLMGEWDATIRQVAARLAAMTGATFDTSPDPDDWNVNSRLATVLESAVLQDGGGSPWKVVFVCPLRRPHSATIVPAGFDLGAALAPLGEVVEHEVGDEVVGHDGDPVAPGSPAPA